MSVNYELVYKGRIGYDRVRNAKNKATEAAKHAEQEEDRHRAEIARLVGVKVDQLHWTNIACLAEGIPHHVELGSGPRGVGKYKCIFCGCDDFDI